MSYKIANLLQFYMVTMRRTLGEEAILSVTLKEFELRPSVYHLSADDTTGSLMLHITFSSTPSRPKADLSFESL
jgi:hypothetical protein